MRNNMAPPRAYPLGGLEDQYFSCLHHLTGVWKQLTCYCNAFFTLYDADLEVYDSSQIFQNSLKADDSDWHWWATYAAKGKRDSCLNHWSFSLCYAYWVIPRIRFLCYGYWQSLTAPPFLENKKATCPALYRREGWRNATRGGRQF